MSIADFVDSYPNFTLEEMRCPCAYPDCPEVPTKSPEFRVFMDTLQELRVICDFPFHMTSIFRCSAYNDMIYIRDFGAKTGEHLTGPHTKGAGDQVISFERMYQLVTEATARGMGVGIKQHGDVAKRYVHLDTQGPRLWSYN